MPGMAGDNFFHIPSAYHISKQLGTKVDVVVDEGSTFVCSLLNAQPWVNEAKPTHGVLGHPLGGQPYDFGRDPEFRSQYDQVWHLGYREYPMDSMVSATRNQCGFQFTDPQAVMTERCVLGSHKSVKYLALSIESSWPPRTINTLRTLLPIRDQLAHMFEKVFIIAHKWGELEYGELLNHRKYELYNDQGDLTKTVELLDNSILVGGYSAMWALCAACLKGPQVVIMDQQFYTPAKITNPEYERVAMVDDWRVVLDQVRELKTTYGN